MTKVEAIKKVLEDYGGAAPLSVIYRDIDRYYSAIKKPKDWKAALRGILYREIYNERNFKKIGPALFGLIEYTEELEKVDELDIKRMHPYIEGVCLELGNFTGFETYTADPNAFFKEKVKLKDLASISDLPTFTYTPIIEISKRIDVLWLNREGFRFPKKAFEVVDSVNTLGEAFNRTFQLSEFAIEFYIVSHKKYQADFERRVTREPYIKVKDRYKFKSYEEVIRLYELEIEKDRLNFFG